MNIRTVKANDLLLIAPLSCTVNKMHVDAYPDIYKPMPTDAAEELLASKASAKNVFFRVAENENGLLGYCISELREVGETSYTWAFRYIYLAEIMIDPSHQRTGVGQALIADLKSIARNQKINRIETDVSEFNSVSHDFFTSQGFDLLRERLSLIVAD